MKPQDIPNLDEVTAQTPTDLLVDIRNRARNDLFFFVRGILGYDRTTENCHGPLCAFIQHNPKRFKRILMPRDHQKTTTVTIGGNMWRAIRDTNERILIANESATNAERMLRGIRQHCESNRVFRTLFSDLLPADTRRVRWNDSELDWNRTKIYPEPTFDTIGMTGSVTSRHYSHMCFDDPISEEAIKSEKVMQDTINRLSAVTALLSSPEVDTVWLVGTRWAFHDVYSWFDKSFPTLTGKFSRSVLEDGKPIFPELLSMEMIDIKRQVMGPYKFSCLMMNNPRNADIQELQVDKIRRWEWADSAQSVLRLFDINGDVVDEVPLASLDITATVDLAPAETIRSDRNAVTTIGVAPKGYVVMLECFAKRCSPIELMEYLFLIHRKYHIRTLGIEGVAYQKAFKYFLREECDRRNVWMNITELKATGKKEIRVRGLQPVIAVGRFYVHSSHQLFLQEAADFPLGEHDDTVDSASMHLQIANGWFNQERNERYLAAEAKVLRRAGFAPRDKEDDSEDLAWMGKLGRWGNVQVSTFE